MNEAKRQHQRKLIATLHPGFPIEPPGSADIPDFDGGPRGEETYRSPAPEPVGLRDEVAWGEEYEVDASLLLPWTEDGEQ